jgi:sugar (pentulose or hexulose) kinase
MSASPVIAVFDIGRTNKKIFLIDEQYKIVFEDCVVMEEIVDEDGFPCEDVHALTRWVTRTFETLLARQDFVIRGVNASAYGASFVHLEHNNLPFLPLYNYLKPYPPSLQQKFYETYGGERILSLETASPVLGNLNSGLQLYYLKHERPELFRQIKCSLHLPQYICFIISNKIFSEITSIGCHTHLWSFTNKKYHWWVEQEGLHNILPPLSGAGSVVNINTAQNPLVAGIGLHDSSAALLPYLVSFNAPFVLISTGTWCISLNPFDHSPLTPEDLQNDCLCYLSFEGKPVKASRLFAGNEHEQQVKRLSAYFHKPAGYYASVAYDREIIAALRNDQKIMQANGTGGSFSDKPLSTYRNYEEAYHQLIYDIIVQQKISTGYVINGTGIRRIFVDGGFSKNSVYMFLLAAAFPGTEIYGASVSQASAIGAAMVMHKHWNTRSLPGDIVTLHYYATGLR